MIPKFRAWLKNENKMMEVRVIDWNNEVVDLFNPHIEIPLDKIELMQSTGLVDKEGTEVFEGDILHHQIQTEYTFIVKYDKDNARWYGDGLSRTYRIDLMKHFMQYYKIIGNIYENPELLEEEE